LQLVAELIGVKAFENKIFRSFLTNLKNRWDSDEGDQHSAVMPIMFRDDPISSRSEATLVFAFC